MYFVHVMFNWIDSFLLSVMDVFLIYITTVKNQLLQFRELKPFRKCINNDTELSFSKCLHNVSICEDVKNCSLHQSPSIQNLFPRRTRKTPAISASPRDGRLSASWGLIEGTPELKSPTHHITIIFRGLRGGGP